MKVLNRILITLIVISFVVFLILYIPNWQQMALYWLLCTFAIQCLTNMEKPHYVLDLDKLKKIADESNYADNKNMDHEDDE